MPCNPDGYVFSLCTDASYYTANATSVDAVCHYYGGGISDGNNGIIAPTWDYTMRLQRQDMPSGAWVTARSATGYFRHATPTKVFYLSGLAAGTYRVQMSYKARENSSYSGSIATYTFRVDR